MAIAASPNLRAEVLFDNGVGPATDFSSAFVADTSEGSDVVGNVFTPVVSGTGDFVVFDGFYIFEPPTPPTDNFTVSLYSTDADGVPIVPDGSDSSTVLTSSLVGLSISAIGTYNGHTVYQYSAHLTSPFSLSSSNSYFMAFTDADAPASLFSLLTSDSGPSSDLFQIANGDVESYAYSSAFEIEDAPEPSTYAMMFGGLALLGLLLRRKRAVVLA